MKYRSREIVVLVFIGVLALALAWWMLGRPVALLSGPN